MDRAGRARPPAAAPSPPEALEIARVEGCYVGQEPMFRVHAQGKAARALRALVLDGDGPADRGAIVAHAAKPQAGAVTSSVVSPAFGPIAMAYLRHTAWEIGGEVAIGDLRAIVRALPLA